MSLALRLHCINLNLSCQITRSHRPYTLPLYVPCDVVTSANVSADDMQNMHILSSVCLPTHVDDESNSWSCEVGHLDSS